jgi:hypothetical protein
VNRQYKISDDLIVVTLEINFKNLGDKPTSEYHLSFDEREKKFMNTIIATANRKTCRHAGKSFEISDENGMKVVHLPKPVGQGEERTIFVGYTLGQYLLFTTEEITLKNMRIECFFNTTVDFVSPYETVESNLEITGVTKNTITRLPNIDKMKQKLATVTVGPITEKPEKNEFFMEYFTFKALPYVSVINTTTTVSHWGNTKQESFVEVHNNGPKFAGEFNRIDFKESSNCYIQNIPIRPPKESYNFWASDESGQLQKEIHLIQNDLDAPLRGPMLPSWKATFTIGWTVKTSQFVKDNYVFTAPLFPRTFGEKGSSVNFAHSEFIFPEGAVITKVNVPSAIHAKVRETEKVCNLDFKGRKTVEIEAERLSSVDDITISIEYELQDKFAFYKIAYLSLGFGIVFFAIFILRRIDLSIKHQKQE